MTMTYNNVMGNGTTGAFSELKPVEDLTYNLTKDSVVIIGSTTWIAGSPKYHESAIPIVLSKYPDKIIAAADVVSGDDTPSKIISYIQNKYPAKDIIILGGLYTFSNLLPMCHEFYINIICSNGQGSCVFSSNLCTYLNQTACFVDKTVVHETQHQPKLEMYHYRRSIH